MKLYDNFIDLTTGGFIFEGTIDITSDSSQVIEKKIDSPADVTTAVEALDVKSPQSWDSNGNISGGEIVQKFRGIKTWNSSQPSYDYISKKDYNITQYLVKVKMDGNEIQKISYGSLASQQKFLNSSSNTNIQPTDNKNIDFNTLKNIQKDQTNISPKKEINLTKPKDVESYISKNFALNSPYEINLENGKIRVGVQPRTCGQIAWSLFESPWSNKSYATKEYNSENGATILKIAKERVKSGYSLPQGEDKTDNNYFDDFNKNFNKVDATRVDTNFKIKQLQKKEGFLNNNLNKLNENYNAIDVLTTQIFNLIGEQYKTTPQINLSNPSITEKPKENYTDWEIFVELALDNIARDSFWDFITSPHKWSVEIDMWGNKTSKSSQTNKLNDIILKNILTSLNKNEYDNKLEKLSSDLSSCAKNSACRFIPGMVYENNIVQLLGGTEKINDTIKSINDIGISKGNKEICQNLNVINNSSSDLRIAIEKVLERSYNKTNLKTMCSGNKSLPLVTPDTFFNIFPKSQTETGFDTYLGKVILNYNFNCEADCQIIEQSVNTKEFGLRQFLSQEDFVSLQKELDNQNPNVDWHSILTIASLLTIFIPGSIFVRLAASTLLDVIDAGVYLSEGNKTAAGLTVAMGLLPEILESSVKGIGKGLSNLIPNNDKVILKKLIDYDGGKSLLNTIKKGGKLTPEQVVQLNTISKNKSVFESYINSNLNNLKKLLKPNDEKVINNLKNEFGADFQKQFHRKMNSVDANNLIKYVNASVKLNKPLELAARGSGLLSGLSMIGIEFIVPGGNEGLFRSWFLKQVPSQALKAGWDWTSLKIAFFNEYPPFGEDEEKNKKYYKLIKDNKGNEQYVLNSQSIVDSWKKGWRPKDQVGGYSLGSPEEQWMVSTP